MQQRIACLLIGGSIYEKGDDGKFYNTSLVFDSGGKITGKYRKMHIPHDPNYYEQHYFSPGDLGYVQVNTGKIVVAPLICYDQWYPEAPASMRSREPRSFFIRQQSAGSRNCGVMSRFLRGGGNTRCALTLPSNGIFVAAVNRVGREGDLRFWGGSFVADPFGEVVARASHSWEAGPGGSLDLNRISVSQEGWGFLHNRRPNSYTDLTR